MDLPPVKICKRNILHRIDIQLYLAIDFLPPSGKFGKSKIPLSVTTL